jgi:hypothetical protein
MYGCRREGWQAYGDVLGGFVRGGVLNPFSRMHGDGLSGGYLHHSVFVSDLQTATEDNGVFQKFRSLARLLPSLRAAHVGYADALLLIIHSSNILVDDLGFVSRRLNAGSFLNECRQHFPPDFQVNPGKLQMNIKKRPHVNYACSYFLNSFNLVTKGHWQ